MKAFHSKPGFLLLYLFLSACFIQADEIYLPQESYLLPRIVYVGDKARMVATLGPAFNNAETSQFLQFVQVTPDTGSIEVYSEPAIFRDVVINEMSLEKRNNTVRLIIDFVCYAPGIYVLPPLAIKNSENETILLGGIEINVASILTPDHTAVSLPALPLAFPGTGFLVYGTLGIVLILLVLGVTGFLFAHKFLGPIKNRQRKRRLLMALENTLAELKTDTITSNPEAERELFSLLAAEFREFLSFVTNIDCRVLTPAEFYNLPLAHAGGNDPDYFCGLFRRWDRIRFSGTGMARNDVLSIADELAAVISDILNTEQT